jgi:hypothetical protein
MRSTRPNKRSKKAAGPEILCRCDEAPAFELRIGNIREGMSFPLVFKGGHLCKSTDKR